MRRLLLAAVCLGLGLAGCRGGLSPAEWQTFQQAQQTFDQAQSRTDYLLSASLYEQLLERGVRSGAVFYNLGNAYMRGGERGRAIAAYRQAQRYLPRDPQLAANLRFALGDRTAAPFRSGFSRLVFWHDWLSYPAKFWWSGVVAAAAFSLGLAGRFTRWEWASRISLGLLLVTSILAASAMDDWYRFEQQRHGVIVVPQVIARKGNAPSYEPALTSPLVEGTEFLVEETRGEWFRVRLPEGQLGWLPATAVVTY